MIEQNKRVKRRSFKRIFFHEKDKIRPDSPNGSFYLEKLHIWES